MKHGKKVRRVEIEKVKDGKGGHLHKVTAHYHDSPGKSGKGFSGAIGKYEPPEETYHKGKGAAHSHVKNLVGQMTATPEDEPDGDEAVEERSNDPMMPTRASVGKAS